MEPLPFANRNLALVTCHLYQSCHSPWKMEGLCISQLVLCNKAFVVTHEFPVGRPGSDSLILSGLANASVVTWLLSGGWLVKMVIGWL